MGYGCLTNPPHYRGNSSYFFSRLAGYKRLRAGGKAQFEIACELIPIFTPDGEHMPHAYGVVHINDHVDARQVTAL